MRIGLNSTLSLFAVIVVSGAAFAQSDRKQPSTSTISLHQASLARYQRWVDEDVRWIISDEEHQAFLKLTNEEERDQFVVQFWLRRDPTPGTEENEYKEEHYRRIAYSNEHFAAQTMGAMTDRGRIYIVYGPPDAIQQHTIDGVPEEIWHYDAFSRSAQFVLDEGKLPRTGNKVDLEFLDNCRCNEFRLHTPEPK